MQLPRNITTISFMRLWFDSKNTDPIQKLNNIYLQVAQDSRQVVFEENDFFLESLAQFSVTLCREHPLIFDDFFPLAISYLKTLARPNLIAVVSAILFFDPSSPDNFKFAQILQKEKNKKKFSNPNLNINLTFNNSENNENDQNDQNEIEKEILINQYSQSLKALVKVRSTLDELKKRNPNAKTDEIGQELMIETIFNLYPIHDQYNNLYNSFL